MSLTASVVKHAAWTWFRELGYAVGHGPHRAPAVQNKVHGAI